MLGARLAPTQLPAQPKSASNLSEKRAHLNDLLISKLVYGKKLLEELPPPGAPEPTSPLNPLLLHRFLRTEIERLTSTSIPLTRQELYEVKSKIRYEEAEIKTTKLLTSALRTRIELLEREVGTQKPQGNENDEVEVEVEVEVAEKLIHELEGRYTVYNKAQRKFLRELSKFVNTHLAKLLAAEGLGGPVVGDDLDIDVSSGAIFNKFGKVRKERGKGQQTIHDMFSSHSKQKGKKRGHEGGSDDSDNDEGEKVEPNVKAAKELKGLLEELMNKTLEAEGYVVLERGDSAAARFLVRSKVAVFHPKDARRVRLVEFGRGVED